ncbi:MAG: hypothetical protein AAF577_08355 [Pseudomonadota bacterium]
MTPLRWLFVAGFAALVVPLAGCDETDRIAFDEQMAEGRAAEIAGDKAAAREAYHRAVALDEDSAIAHVALGELAERERLWRPALNHYYRATRSTNPGPAPFLHLARLNAERGALEQALRYVIAAYRFVPNDAAVLSQKAILLGRVGLSEAAVSNAEAALALAPRDVSATLAYVRLRIARDGPDKALQALSRLAGRDDPDVVALALDLLDRLGRPDEAIDQLRARVAMWRNLARADGVADTAWRTLREPLVLDLAERQLRAGDLTGATATLSRWLEVDPEAMGVLDRLVDLVFVDRGLAEAEAVLAQAVARAPLPPTPPQGLFTAGSDPVLQERELRVARFAQLRARLLVMAGRTAEAATLIEAPGVAEGLTALRTDLILSKARHWHAAGYPDRALSMLAALVLDRAHEPAAARAFVDHALVTGEVEAAHEILDRAIVIHGAARAPAETLVAMADLEAALGNARKVAALYDTSLARAAADPATLAGVIRFEFSLGQSTAARKRSSAALRDRPFSPELLETEVGIRLAAGQVAPARRLIRKAAADAKARGDRMPMPSLAVDMALASARAGDDPAAQITALARMLIEDPDCTAPAIAENAALRALAILRGMGGDTQRLQDDLRQIAETAIQRAPGLPSGWRLMAALQVDSNAALNVLDQGLTRTAQTAPLREDRASLLEALGRTDDALAERRLLFAHDPASRRAVNNYVSLALEAETLNTRRLDDLAALAERLQGAATPHFLDTLGWLAVLSGDDARGLALLEQAADALPDSALVHYHLGIAQGRLGRIEASKATMRQALSLDSHKVFRYHDYAERLINDRLRTADDPYPKP